ncbi:hypothetical protein Pan216_54510 [Planctomycetes bacterium Pan216]|uniref:Uncharacterized protein n=1 Tax=Kolteria novifilia TaxID=2527975 RepID=A0A518BC58_9BACT|nr:hypothetical protein Pan216_54510 [Planctomycetes bacterium Pan216]
MAFDQSFWIMALVAAGCFAVFTLINLSLSQQRTQELHRFARRMGFEFAMHPAHFVLEGVDMSHLRFHGRFEQVRNLIDGNWRGIHIRVFDFHFREGNESVVQTVFMAESNEVELPAFMLRPANSPFDKLKGLVTLTDINFKERPGFSARYRLVGNDASRIRSIFTEQLLDRIVDSHDLHLEGMDHRLIFFHARVTVPTKGICGFIDEGLQYLSLLSGTTAPLLS